ncbi:hypothetical protein IWZ03DRAFT_133926 [Phyllosticta citriasiana]|uniref:Uncharacterized protein n=1 Tax=Phyllosticta citriasiana TaxID=595635 RepID=A0ABR1KRW4_9PEZI
MYVCTHVCVTHTLFYFLYFSRLLSVCLPYLIILVLVTLKALLELVTFLLPLLLYCFRTRCCVCVFLHSDRCGASSSSSSGGCDCGNSQ